ncbi:MarR family winged helix-turn-helix transcriptional regulator [Actinoplanes philippinensis]|uniref:MarR family winged helix-turn-helix transcriptional regulator n=1 Tax=Actinoplanes philippinensis TaxID=35752 RepID=UPI00340EF83C
MPAVVTRIGPASWWDRRRNIVAVTEAGSRHLHDLNERALAVQDELLIALDPGEREQLRALLAKVLDSHPAQPAS